MQIGPRHWGWVSSDSAGVPHGGQYGNIPWFERQMKDIGVITGWSRRRNCFGICVQRGPARWFCLMLLANKKGAIAASPDLVSVLRYAWTRHCRQSGATVMQWLQDVERERKAAYAKEHYERSKVRIEECAEAAVRAAGIVSPKVISIPAQLGRKGT